MSNLHGFDMFFIALYFLILLGIAWWAARREKAEAMVQSAASAAPGAAVP